MPTEQRTARPREEHTADLHGVRILYLVTEDWYFCSHRLPIARAARDAGADVVVATRVDRHGETIEREGFRLVPLPWRRRSSAGSWQIRTQWSSSRTSENGSPEKASRSFG